MKGLFILVSLLLVVALFVPINDCNILITHGGVGSIISGLKKDKKVIAVPRLEKYKEHVNDHQLQIIENFNNKKYIIGIKDTKVEITVY